MKNTLTAAEAAMAVKVAAEKGCDLLPFNIITVMLECVLNTGAQSMLEGLHSVFQIGGYSTIEYSPINDELEYHHYDDNVDVGANWFLYSVDENYPVYQEEFVEKVYPQIVEYLKNIEDDHCPSRWLEKEYPNNIMARIEELLKEVEEESLFNTLWEKCKLGGISTIEYNAVTDSLEVRQYNDMEWIRWPCYPFYSLIIDGGGMDIMPYSPELTTEEFRHLRYTRYLTMFKNHLHQFMKLIESGK